MDIVSIKIKDLLQMFYLGYVQPKPQEEGRFEEKWASSVFLEGGNVSRYFFYYCFASAFSDLCVTPGLNEPRH